MSGGGPKDVTPRFGGGIFVYGRQEVPPHGQMPEATPTGEGSVICGGPFLGPASVLGAGGEDKVALGRGCCIAFRQPPSYRNGHGHWLRNCAWQEWIPRPHALEARLVRTEPRRLMAAVGLRDK